MHDILDLESFPLHKPDSSAWHALVKRCRADLDAQGMFNLEGLMRPEAVKTDVDSISPKFEAEAFRHERDHNIYFLKSLDDLPPEHPALQRFHTSNQTLCADQITDTALSRLYDWAPFASFLAATMQRPVLHPMADPLARINVMSYKSGQALNWHFDRSEFTTTLLLQAPESGGEFEYRTDLRTETDPNYDGVARLLMGQDPRVERIRLAPGTLNVFKGKNCAHRVTEVQGQTPRIIAVFSFYDDPGVTFSDDERIGFYGRAS